MAFTAGKSKEIEGKSNDWLLDQSLMQSMQTGSAMRTMYTWYA